MRNWNVSCEPLNISIQTWVDSNRTTASVASASLLDGVWWINRVKVHPEDLRKGIGAGLVGRLQAAVVGRQSAVDPREAPVMRVCPGGYNTPPKEQQAFYAACEFKVTEKDPYGGDGVTMEWTPLWAEFTKKAVG